MLKGPEQIPILRSPGGDSMPSIQPVRVIGSPLFTYIVGSLVTGFMNGAPVSPILPA